MLLNVYIRCVLSYSYLVNEYYILNEISFIPSDCKPVKNL